MRSLKKKKVVLSRGISSLLALGTVTVPIAIVKATSDIWDGSTDGVWATSTNWLTDPAIVPGTGDTATFNGAGNGFTTINLGGGNVGTGVTIGNILFDTAGAAAYTLGSGPVGSQTLTLDNAGSITVNATVTKSELVNASLVLGNDGSAQTFNLVNQSTAAGQLLTIAGSLTGSTGAGVKTLAVGGAGNTLISGAIGNGPTGTVSLIKSNAGALTLSGANSFTGGTVLNGGTLNVNNAAALGNTAAGGFTVTGGTLDNTSGAAITTSAAKAINLNGDLTVVGTNDLNFNGGVLTLGGTAGTRTLAVNAGTFTIGNLAGGAGFNLSKTGNGNLFLSTLANNLSTIAGILDIQGGRVQAQADVTVGGLTGSGIFENGGAASKWLFVNNAADNTFSGTIRGNPNNAAVRYGLVKRGVGTLNLTGTNSFIDNFAIENGTVRMTGINTVGIDTVNGVAQIGTIANQSGILVIDGGTLNANKTNAPSLNIGTVANANGSVKISSGTLTSISEAWIGSSGYGALTMTGGTLNCGNWFALGRGNAGVGNGIGNINGGTINVTGQNFTTGSFTGAVGIVNLSSGAINVTSTAGGQGGYLVAEGGNAILNVSGTGALTISGARGLHLAVAGGIGIANLDGGTVTTPLVQQGSGTGTLNFNGGTLRPSAASTSFMQGLTNSFVFAGGANIDTNGNAITIGQSLLVPNGSGASAIAVASGGAGYIDTPLVTLSGGSGTGATAVASVTGGVLTGFTITNPGVGYQPGDILTAAIVGGGPTTPATAGAITLAPNIGGGLTKSGAGTLTLSGVNTYSGVTTVSSGTLLLDPNGSINGSSGITINGTGAKFVQTSATPISSPVTLTKGTLDGTTTINSVTVGDGTGGVITNGNGGIGTLTIGALTFNGAGTLNLVTGTPTPELLTTTTLLTGVSNPTGLVTINAANTNQIWSNGVYNLITYSTLGGQGFANFTKGTIAGLGSRQNATLTNSAGLIALTIGGDLPVWTGLQNGNWTTVAVPGLKNWKLQAAGTPTDFINNDTVVFNDTATGTTALNISDANVNTTSITFDNSTLNYSVASTGGFGIASGFLVKTGTGNLTLGTPSTYAGGTTLTNGTLNINHASAIGTGALTINGGIIDNTSGAAVALTTNNAQTWNADVLFAGTNNLNLGTGAVPLPATRVITTGGTGTLTVGGVISGNGFGITKAGPGTLVLSGANTYTGATLVTGGTLRLTGAINAGNAANLGQINVGDLGADNAVLEIAGATINATKPGAPGLVVGNIGGVSGAVRMSGGTLNINSEGWIGGAAGSYGAFDMSGGAVTVGNWLALGRDGTGVLNLSGGTFNVTTQNMTAGSFGDGTAVINVSGGALSATNTAAGQGTVIVGEGGSAVLNLTGTGVVNAAGPLGVQLGRTGQGEVNLNGGTINATIVDRGTGSGIFNFNGGTLRPTAANVNFMTGLTNAYVYAGGGTIDTNGSDITIAQPLLAPTGSGLTATGLTVTGSGFIATPVVTVNGGGGTGATAIANLDANGNLTGITITNPGVDYSSDPFFNVLGGGGTGNITGSPALVANVSGGITKAGAGTLTLTGASTYTGTTNINAGTLRVSNTTGSATGTGPVSVNTGSILTGGGAIGGTATVASGGTLSPGENGVGVITVGGLTLAPGSILTYEWDIAQNNDRIVVTTPGGLTISGGKLNLFNAGGSTIFSINGVYNLIGYSGNITGNPSNLSVDPASVTAGKSYTFGTNGGFVTLVIGPSGVTPNFWNVNADGQWTTGSNWTLNIPPNAAQAFANFGGGGTPITAPRTVTLNANQTVGSLGFNSAQPFTIAGANTLTLDNGTDSATIAVTGGRHTIGVAMNALSPTVQFNVVSAVDSLAVSGALGGTAGVTKIGAGQVTMSGANTYTGTTTVNSGTLALVGAGKLGNAANPLVVAGGTLELGGTSQTVGATTITGGSINNGTLNPVSLTANGAANTAVSANIGGAATVNKTGTGTLALSGNSTYTGTTTLNGGTLAITGNTALGADSAPINFTAGTLSVLGTTTSLSAHPLTGFPGVVDVNATDNTFTIGQNIAATNPFVKRGLGTLALSGNNTFAATLAVNAGTLIVTGGTTTETGAGNVPIQVANEAGATAIMTVAGTATVNSGTSELYLGQGFATADGTLNLQDSGTVSVNNWIAVGRSNGTGTVNMSGGTLNKLGGNATHVTIGSNTTASTGMFNQSGGIVNSADSDFFVGESGNGTYTVSGTAQANLQAVRLAVNANSSGTFNLNGGTVTATQVITGGGFGALNWNGGTLRAAASSADFIGSSVGTTVQAGGAIVDTNGQNVTVNAFLVHDFALNDTPDGGFTKRGAGVLTLTSASSYTGQTVVEAGTLAVAGSIGGSTSIAVRSGATLDATLGGGLPLNNTQTLGGSGTVIGNVSADNGAKLSPGDTIGNLTIAGNVNILLAVTPSASGALLFGLAASNDRITLTGGALTIGTGVLGFSDFTFSTLAGLAPGSYTLFDSSTPIIGTLDNSNLAGSLGNGFTGTLALADNGNDIVLTVVPEPNSAAALLAGLAPLLGLRRFRRRSA